uniref:Uncharacterized protein n=1 Tax=Steinernema glaseri TaxID=37863 RepID=A0A1I7YZW4_9BILA
MNRPSSSVELLNSFTFINMFIDTHEIYLPSIKSFHVAGFD